jgi:hypothetical protein
LVYSAASFLYTSKGKKSIDNKTKLGLRQQQKEICIPSGIL